MKQAMPWSVKGVNSDARDAAKEAARRAGMTLGEWLNTVIAETAAEREAEAGGEGTPSTAAVEEQLQRLHRAAVQTAADQQARGANDLASILQRAMEQSRDHANQVETRTVGALDAMVKWFERSEKQTREQVGSLAQAQERTSVALREALTLVSSRLDSLDHSIDAGRERDFAPIRSAVRRLEDRIDDLDRREAEGLVPAHVQRSLRQVEERLVDLATKMAMRGPASDLADPARIDRIETTLAAVLDRIGGTAAMESAASDDLDSALGQIRARQRALDGFGAPAARSRPEDARSAREMEALRLDISGLTRRLDDLRHWRPDPDLPDMRRELAELSAAVRGWSPREAIESLEHTLKGVTRQIASAPPASLGSDAGGSQLQQLCGELSALAADLTPLKALGSLRDDIDSLGRRLDRLADGASGPAATDGLAAELAELKTLVGRTAPAAGVVGPLEETLAELTRRIDAGLGGAQPIDAGEIQALQKSVDDMRWTLGALQDVEEKRGSGIERIEKRLDAIGERMATLGGGTADESVIALTDRVLELQKSLEAKIVDQPDISGLETLIVSLRDRMDEAARPDASIGALDALETQIAAMTGALERTDEQASALKSMERAIADLFDRIEDTKRSTIEAAERAVEKAAQGAAQAMTEAGEPRPAAPDRRTTQALEAVQQSMDRIVERLAGIEADITSDRVRILEIAEKAAATPSQPKAQAPAQPAPQTAAEKIAAAAAAAEAARRAAAEQPRTPRPPAPAPAPAADPFGAAAATLMGLGAPAAAAAPEAPVPAPVEARVPEPAATVGTSALLPDDLLLEPGTGRPTPTDDTDSEADAGTSKPLPKPGSPMSSFIASAREAARTGTAAPAAGDAKSDAKAQKAAAKAAEKEAKAAAKVAAKEAKAGTKAVLGDEPLDLADVGEASGSTLAQIRAVIQAKRRVIVLALGGIVLALGIATVAKDFLAQPEPPIMAAPPAETARPIAPAPAPAPAAPAPAGVEKQSSLLDPNPQGAGSFTTASPLSPPRPPVVKPRDPETVSSIGQAGPASSSSPAMGEQARGTAAVIDLPVGTLPASLAKAAQAGNLNAAYEVANRYFDGRGVARDPFVAAKWFEKAASQGFAPAQYRLGSMYEKGIGVTADATIAKNWYRQAADRGNAKAMHNLGVLIAEGSAGKPDYEAAIVWFKRAADLGVRDSQYNLAILTARGLGTPQNLAQSYTWFTLAAAQGDEDAARKRDEVATRLDAATLASAKASAETFKPGRLEEAANDVTMPAGGWDAEASAIPGSKAKPKN